MIKEKITEIKEIDLLTERIIACSYRVHSKLGPGFNENVYQNALEIDLKKESLRFETEKSFMVSYLGKNVGKFRLDLVVEDKVVVEVKALTGNMPTVFESQVLSYLKASGHGIGLLINFGNKSCQVRRLMVNLRNHK